MAYANPSAREFGALENPDIPTNASAAISNDEIDVKEVRTKWRVQEDYSVAEKLQKEEFDVHYDANRSERQLVGGDVKKTKVEQELEDKYAAEYYEQLRLDQEKADEELAAQIQRELEAEEHSQLAQTSNADEELARRLQLEEEEKLRQEKATLDVIAQNDKNYAARLAAEENAKQPLTSGVPTTLSTLPATGIGDQPPSYEEASRSRSSASGLPSETQLQSNGGEGDLINFDEPGSTTPPAVYPKQLNPFASTTIPSLPMANGKPSQILGAVPRVKPERPPPPELAEHLTPSDPVVENPFKKHARLYPDESGLYMDRVEKAKAENDAKAAAKAEMERIRMQGKSAERIGMRVLPPGKSPVPKKF